MMRVRRSVFTKIKATERAQWLRWNSALPAILSFVGIRNTILIIIARIRPAPQSVANVPTKPHRAPGRTHLWIVCNERLTIIFVIHVTYTPDAGHSLFPWWSCHWSVSFLYIKYLVYSCYSSILILA